MTPFPDAPNSMKERLLWALRFGHNFNPDPQYANLRNLDEGRVLKMHGDEPDAKLLIASWQESDGNVEAEVLARHGRELHPDGDVGPATESVMAFRRCAMPDYPPPPDATFDYGDPELNRAVESQQEFAAYVGGTGSWPKGCDPKHPDWHSVVVGMDTSGASAHQKGLMAEVLRMVEATEAEIGQSVRHVLDGSVSRPQHDVRFQFIAGGTIGFAYFPTPNQCNQVVNARLDNSFNADKFTLADLFTHEYKGHSDGLNHSRGGIMNASIGRPTKPSSWISDPHESTKRRYFGGVAIPTTPVPGPGPGPTPANKLWLRSAAGGFEVVALKDFTAKTNDVLGKFQFVPYPESQ